jgi:hypothetical protein
LWPLIYFQQHGGLPAKAMDTIIHECEAEQATIFMKTKEADTQQNYKFGRTGAKI